MNLLKKTPLQIRQESISRHFQQFKLKQQISNFQSNLKNNLLYGHNNKLLNCGFMIGNMNTGAYRGSVGGWDFQETFSDDQTTLDARWGQAGTLCKPVAASGNFSWSGLRVATNNAMATQPVGATVSDTAWVLRLKLSNTNLTPGTYSSYFGFGMRSVSQATGAVSGTPDSLMATIYTRTADTPKWYFEGDNNTPWASPQMGANVFTAIPTTTSYWYEMIRLTSTTATFRVFATSSFLSPLEEKAGVTISSSIVDLDYLTFQNDNNGDIGGTFNGTGDDIQFANGVTVAP